MRIQDLLERYDVEIATIINYNDWVKTKAREIDLSNELPLVKYLDQIMKYFRVLNTFVGVSSNNIYWNLTPCPIRVMLIPTAESKYITLVNPKILKLEGRDINSVEACGSVPDYNYEVKRKPYVSVSGYTIEKKYIELEYGSTDYYAGDEPVFSSYSNKEWIIQHEMDHLDGITIKDKGTIFDLNRLIEP